jgi:hypothetical protein
MTGYLLRVDDVLRRAPWTTRSQSPWSAARDLVGYVILFGTVYGAVMGAFGGFFGDRLWQIVYSALKVPLLLLATFLISLPSFFVINTLFGLRRDLGEAIRALIAAQAAVATILAALSPLTALWYVSSADYQAAVLFNASIFAVSSFAAQWLLRGFYRPLIARNRMHRTLLRTWIVVYALVGIQMAWILRPFVGSPTTPVQFFREDSWGNAYVVVAHLVWEILTR